MNKWRRDLGKNRVIRTAASIRIAVVCLGLLFVLTFWGTVAQIDQGLYGAQERFFFSWMFLAGGFFPFPGAKLVLWVLFVNLFCVSLTRFVYDRRHIGITIIHMGLLSYFVAAFVTFYGTVESHVTMLEGAGTNLSQSYREWELSFWPENGNSRDVTAIDAAGFREGAAYAIGDMAIRVETYYPNAQAFTSGGDQAVTAMSNSGIRSLTKMPTEKEPEKNIPGGIFEIAAAGQPVKYILYGGESRPNQFNLAGKTVNVQLRRKNLPLPFVIQLKEFEKQVHPGTEIARAYQSLVTVAHDGLTREVLIWMNHPLRFKDYTLYQASYSVDRFGREYSTLAVVKNAGRLMPYVSAFVTLAGLVIHFSMMGLSRGRQNA